MATEGRGSSTSIEQKLLEGGHRFEFFQAMRWLRLLELNRPGEDKTARHDWVVFRTPVTLDFPAGEIAAIDRVPQEPTGQGAAYQVTVNFLGLTGPSGVLPWHYTESLIAAKARHTTLAPEESLSWDAPHDFLDIFSHRMTVLFEKAWEKHHFWVRYERGEHEYLSRNILSFAGLGADSLHNRLRDSPAAGIDDQALAYYAGLLSRRPMSAAAIRGMVADYFGVTTRIEQFSGRWLELPKNQMTMLGLANTRLGEDASLGERAWDRQGKVRVVLGPMSPVQLERLLPRAGASAQSNNQHEALRNLLQFALGIGLDFDVQLVVHRYAVPASTLNAKDGARLGWSSWLKYREDEVFQQDAADVVLTM